MDRVQLSLIIGGISLVGLAWAVIIVVRENLGSRNGARSGAPDEVPLLSNGLHQFDTKQIGIRVKTTIFGLRSQRLDVVKYKEWVNRLISGAREWFER